MSIEPSPRDAGPSAPSASPQNAGSTSVFKQAPEVWWFLAAQLVVVIALVMVLLV